VDRRSLGSSGLEVSALGLGCRGMSEFDARRDDAELFATVHRALDHRQPRFAAEVAQVDTASPPGTAAGTLYPRR